MRLTARCAAVMILMAMAGPAPGQPYGYFPWRLGGYSYYTPGSWYYYTLQQPWVYPGHWIYSYMPGDGYRAYVYGEYPGTAAPWRSSNAYVPATAARDNGPPARARPTMSPAIPYSELLAEEQRENADDRGYIIIHVPTPDTKVWFDNQLMSQTGLQRQYMTPPLPVRGRTYTFQVRVEIPVPGFPNDPRRVTETLQIRAGQTKTLTFEAE
ncbi:MAG: TIGR03000 domain-containing protein, partial [Gemmataceae bacterium]|nr:TIGR03000 domain-containing protein [Gemmataceae bacterium]